MTEVLAVANQKGGVAKTTTVHSLGVASAELGKRTLVVDLDPQACLTFSLGFDPDALDRSLHDVFVRRDSVAEVSLPAPGVEFLNVLPASIDLAGSEVHLLTRTGREHVLERALEPVLDRYDLILIDCPPSLGVLTINGLTAAQRHAIRQVRVAPLEATITPGVMRAYRRLLDGFRQEAADFCRRRGLTYLPLRSDVSLQEVLVRTFRTAGILV